MFVFTLLKKVHTIFKKLNSKIHLEISRIIAFLILLGVGVFVLIFDICNQLFDIRSRVQQVFVFDSTISYSRYLIFEKLLFILALL